MSSVEINDVISVGAVYLTMILLGAFGVFVIARLFVNCSNYAIPPSVYWFILGVVTSVTVHYVGNCDKINCDESPNLFINGYSTYFINADSHLIYLILLPPLLYESALGTNFYKFQRLLMTSLLLSIIGVFATVGILGLFLKYTLPDSLQSWSEAFLMSSTLASTDPIAVLSVLKELGFPQKIMTIFEGESLLNDGSSVVLFHLFSDMAKGQEFTAWQIAKKLFYLICVSPLIGVAYAVIISSIGRFLRHSTAVFEAIWFTLHCSLIFIIAEIVFGLSGPLASVAYGLYIKVYGYRSLDRKSVEGHHHFVSTIATVSEMLIFELSGAILAYLFLVYESDIPEMGTIVTDGLVTWFYMLIARLDMFVFNPIMNWLGPYHVSTKETTLLWWGGLRGAIVLALANMLYQDAALNETFRAEIPVRIAMCVGFNLVIQGQLFAFVVRIVNPYPPNEFQYYSSKRTFRYIDGDFRRMLQDKFKSSGLTVPTILDVDLSTVGTIHLNHHVGSPTCVAKALFGQKSKTRTQQQVLYKAESMLVAYEAIQPDSSDDDFDEESSADSLFQHIKGRDLSNHQQKFINSIKGAMKIECGLGLRMFLPQYLATVDRTPTSSFLMESGMPCTSQNLLESQTQFGHDDSDDLDFPLENANQIMDYDTPKLIENIFRVLPKFSKLQLDARGNLRYHDAELNIHRDVETWTNHCRRICFLTPEDEDTYQKFLADDETDITVPGEKRDSDIVNPEAESKFIMKTQKNLEKIINISAIIVEKYQHNNKLGILSNSSCAVLSKCAEKCILNAEINLEKLKSKRYDSSCTRLDYGSSHWTELKKSLNIYKYFNGSKFSALRRYRNNPSKLARLATYRECCTDLESILFFIDMHERTVVARSRQFAHMMKFDKSALEHYTRVMVEANTLLFELMNHYGDVFHAAFFIFLSRVVANEQNFYVAEQMKKGLLNENSAKIMKNMINDGVSTLMSFKDWKRQLLPFIVESPNAMQG